MSERNVSSERHASRPHSELFEEMRFYIDRALKADIPLPAYALAMETLQRIEEQFDASEKYAAEGWGWLNEALEALGAETVFDIAQRKERIQQLERDNGRLALEAATADQDWKRAEAEVEKLTHALTQVRAECDLPDYIAEFVGEALGESLSPSSPNVRKSWGPERMRHDPERAWS